MQQISLPQGTFTLAPNFPAQRLVLVAGGRAPSADWLQHVSQGSPVWAIDRGLEACRAAELIPQRLIGDADRASAASWNWAAQNHVPTDRYPRAKDYTDTQLALHTALQTLMEPTVLILAGAWGGRFDHAFSTLFSASRTPWPVIMADERETCFFLRPQQKVTLCGQSQPQAISLLPLTACVTGVTLTGTHWPLMDATLTQAQANAISNELEPPVKELTLQIKTGLLGLYCCWQE